MPLNKFVPLSPDPYITSDPEMTLAKFGHLNTIVDYLNGTNALTNIKIAGINNTAGYIDFSANPTGSTTVVGAIRTYVDGTNLSEVMTFREDGKVGIGTTTPVNLLSIDATNSTLPTEHSAAAATIKSGVQSPLRVLRTGGQPNIWIGTSSTTPNVSSFLFGIRTGAYYNTATPTYSGDYAAWTVLRGNDWGTATSASDLRMSQIFTCDGNTARAALAIYPALVETATNTDIVNMNNLLIATRNSFSTQPLARLQIIGDGSTSATTSLLVQNSAGNSALTISDDLTTTFSNRIKIDYDTISFLGSPSNTFIQQNLGLGFGYYSAAVSNQIMINGQPKIIVKDTGASRASTLIVGHNVSISDAADVSALLEVRSDALYLKGFLKPKMTTVQKNAIVTPAAGLEIYDTDLNRPCFYNGTSWVTL
jgi:hypothetical protein